MHALSSPSWTLFRSEPYRLLFPIGWLWAVVGTWHWIALHLGWTTDFGVLYHGYLQTLGFGGCMATGFLLTALPFFLASQPAKTLELVLAIILALALGATAIAGVLHGTLFAFLLLVILLAAFILRRFDARNGAPPPLTYIVVGLFHGFIGAILALAPIPLWPRLGDRMIEQGFLLSMMLGLGSFLGARFLGTFQPPAFLFRMKPGRPMVPPPVTMQRIFLLGGILLFLSFWLEAGVSPLAGKALRAAVVSFQFFGFARIHRTPQPSLWTTHLLRASYWFTVLGLWLAALWPAQEIAALHVTYIGGFGLMILIIGVRVITNHGGLESWWVTLRYPLIAIALGTAAAMAFRIAAPLLGAKYLSLLAAAALAWLVALLTWGVLLLPRVTPRHRGQTH